jgi:hypothetical protein
LLLQLYVCCLHGKTLELNPGFILCDKGNFYFYGRKGLCNEVLKNLRKDWRNEEGNWCSSDDQRNGTSLSVSWRH